jgi:hypothetical protein
MDWDEMKTQLSQDPDLPGEITISLAYGPGDWLGLGRVECAADLPVVISVKMLTESPQLHVLQFQFLGKSVDLLEVLARLEVWTSKFPTIPALSQEEYRARDAVPSTSGPSIGTDESSV